jgi:ParB family transcriptional regulator, chromosome partitioning protein
MPDALGDIDENLCRNELKLTDVERSLLFKRRKELYLVLNPDTKHGGDRKSEQVQILPLAHSPTTQRIGLGISPRSVRAIVARPGEGLRGTVNARATPAKVA